MAFSCMESVGAERRVDEEHFRKSEMLTRKGRREDGGGNGIWGERGGVESVNRRLIKKEKEEEGAVGTGRL